MYKVLAYKTLFGTQYHVVKRIIALSMHCSKVKIHPFIFHIHIHLFNLRKNGITEEVPILSQNRYNFSRYQFNQRQTYTIRD